MKIIKNVLLVFVVVAAVSATGGTIAQTQLEMNQEACGEYKKADTELNKVYNQILREYQQEKIFVQKLKAAQRAWMAFRDAHLAAIYSDPHPGTVESMCRCLKLTELTNERTKVLRQWIEGIEEGDVCAGSIRWKK